MKEPNPHSIASGYLSAVGRTEGERYELTLEELAWLVDHATKLGGLRVDVLRELQSALSTSDEEGVIADLKEVLTDLIIMQHRLAGRDERLHELFGQLIEARPQESMPVDEVTVRKAIQEIVDAHAHVQAVAGDRTRRSSPEV